MNDATALNNHSASGGVTNTATTSIAGLVSTGRGKFPYKLHEILARIEYRDVISWADHGKSWYVYVKLLRTCSCTAEFDFVTYSVTEDITGFLLVG